MAPPLATPPPRPRPRRPRRRGPGAPPGGRAGARPGPPSPRRSRRRPANSLLPAGPGRAGGTRRWRGPSRTRSPSPSPSPDPAGRAGDGPGRGPAGSGGPGLGSRTAEPGSASVLTIIAVQDRRQHFNLTPCRLDRSGWREHQRERGIKKKEGTKVEDGTVSLVF